ncbi:MAG: TolC family protein [Bacteroidales bacterium]|nr:TolC family protein [Bacteroidales bacterium]
MNGIILTLALLTAGPWSLTDCIEYALDNNISIKQNEITVNQREIDLSNAQARRLPGISGNVRESWDFGRGLTSDNTYATGSNTASTIFNVGLDIPIFQGFDINNGIKVSKLNLAAATTDLEKARDDIRIAVAQAYVQILYNQEILTVAENQVSLDEQLLARITEMKNNGKASAAEVAAQQATLAQSKLNATQASNNLKISVLDLTQLLELESPEGFEIEIPAEESLGIRLLSLPEDVYAEAVEKKAVIQAEKLRVEYAKVSIEKAKSAFYPSLSLSGGLGTGYYFNSAKPSDSFGKQLNTNFSPSLGLNLSIPIFQRLSARNSVKSAQLSFDNQQLQLENTKKNLYKEIQQAYYNALASQSQLQSSEEAATSAEESFRLNTEKYENGKANITEYNESKNRYLEAASNYLQARYKCVYQTMILDFYRGIDLRFR